MGCLSRFMVVLLNGRFLIDQRCFAKMYLLGNVVLYGVCLKIRLVLQSGIGVDFSKHIGRHSRRSWSSKARGVGDSHLLSIFSSSLTEFVSAPFGVLKRNLMLVCMISHFLICDYEITNWWFNLYLYIKLLKTLVPYWFTLFYWYVPRMYSFRAENWVLLPMKLK
jgi:hypothetical protein